MADTLDKLVQLLADVPEEERLTALASLRLRPRAAAEPVRTRTPLPTPQRHDGIVSEIEWV